MNSAHECTGSKVQCYGMNSELPTALGGAVSLPYGVFRGLMSRACRVSKDTQRARDQKVLTVVFRGLKFRYSFFPFLHFVYRF